MKSLKLILLTAAAYLTILSCKDKPITPEMKLTKVYVESGNLNAANTLFTSTGAFKAADKAIGMIDSTNCAKSFNGYVDVQSNVYVFEGGSVPSKIAKLSAYTLFQCFKEAVWKDSYIYELPNDAQICKDEAKYYFRLKGNYPRKEATIKGVKVYRFEDKNVLADYTAFADFHNQLRRTVANSGINLFTALKINPENYTLTTNRSDLVVDTRTGIIDYAKSKPTPLKTLDKIILTPKSKGTTYQFNTLYVVHSPQIITQYFGRGTVALNQDAWKKYLVETVLPNYGESKITGHKCDSCSIPKREIPPPPEPIINNG